MDLVKTKSFELAVYRKGDEDSAKLTLVLPGKLDTKDYAHMRSHVDYLAKKGHLALSFDPPGTWESPGSIELYNMTNWLRAINELIEYFDNRPSFVMGHSRGGGMSILAGTTNPHITHFAVIMSGYSYGFDLRDKESEEEWKTRGYKVHTRDKPPGGGPREVEFKLPYSYQEDSAQFDMSDALKKSTKPKLFILGKTDSLIKPETVKAAFDMSAEPKELYELDSGHDYRHDSELINEVNSVIGKFLDENRF